uniref:Coatomer subunit epsilon n=1 Tax=Parastrongyloides trichosuri TaxID=131310 RepID=A0A0N4Z8V9_PARTI
MSVDILFDVKNSYFLGNYQQCIQAAEKVKCKTDAEKEEMDSYVYRSLIAQSKYSLVISEISPNTDVVSLKCLRRLAEYYGIKDERKDIVLKLDSEVKVSDASNEHFCLLTSLIYINEGDYESALRLLNNCDSLEGQATMIQVLLKIDRVDLAIKKLKEMQEVDEDATITQLASAWVNTALGKDKLKDAFYTYQELIDKYGGTVSLLVSQASCLIQQEKYEDAEKLLLEAQQKDSDNAEVCINLFVVNSYLGKSAESQMRLINQLKQFHPDHPWTVGYHQKEELFEKLTAESCA